jgi:imidazole glycerol-phosphate synthase subunit HisH
MNKLDVAIIDYGMGNVLSVQRGLEHCGATVSVTANTDEIMSASRVLLPGVGAFANGMAELTRQGLDVVVHDVAKKGTPLLGICLGMQMLLDESEEFGLTKGLGLISGKVIPVPSLTADGQQQKIPHIGWNALVLPEGNEGWAGTLLDNIEPNESVYFVHSFMAEPVESHHRIANCLYGNVPVAAVIGKENIWGCQFHPEKSGEVGLSVLRNFLSL